MKTIAAVKTFKHDSLKACGARRHPIPRLRANDPPATQRIPADGLLAGRHHDHAPGADVRSHRAEVPRSQSQRPPRSLRRQPTRRQHPRKRSGQSNDARRKSRRHDARHVARSRRAGRRISTGIRLHGNRALDQHEAHQQLHHASPASASATRRTEQQASADRRAHAARHPSDDQHRPTQSLPSRSRRDQHRRRFLAMA